MECDLSNIMAYSPQPWNWLENREDENDKVFWKNMGSSGDESKENWSGKNKRKKKKFKGKKIIEVKNTREIGDLG